MPILIEIARWPLDSLGNQQKDVDDVQQKKFGYVSLKELENLRVPLGEIPPLLLCQLAMS